MPMTRSSSALIIAIILAGCSPYSYRPEVTAFGSGVDQAVIAFDEMSAKATKRRVDSELAELAKSGGIVDFVDADCGNVALTGPNSPGATSNLGSGPLPDLAEISEQERQRCTLGLLRDTSDDGAGKATPIITQAALQRDLENFSRLSRALRGYADGLTAIVSASDREDLEAAIVRGQGSIENLASAVDPDGAAGEIAGTTSMLAEVFRFSLVTVLDHLRFRALRAAVREANPTVQDAAKLLQKGAVQFVAIDARDALTSLEDEIATEYDQERAGEALKGAQWLSVYQSISSKRDDYLNTLESGDVFQQMAVAHQKLADALSGSASLDQLRVAIEDFLERAQFAYELFAAP